MNDHKILLKALEEVFEPQLDAFTEPSDPGAEHIFSEQFEKNMAKLGKKRKKSHFTMTTAMGRRIACILALTSAVSVSALKAGAVREAESPFYIKENWNHIVVTGLKGLDKMYPPVIEAEYEMTGMPEGFELVERNESPGWITTWYEKGDDYIHIDQTVYACFTVCLDNEHSTFEYFTDTSGKKYLIQDTGYDYDIIWNNGDYIFDIDGNLDKDEMLELCMSMKIK